MYKQDNQSSISALKRLYKVVEFDGSFRIQRRITKVKTEGILLWKNIKHTTKWCEVDEYGQAIDEDELIKELEGALTFHALPVAMEPFIDKEEAFEKIESIIQGEKYHYFSEPLRKEFDQGKTTAKRIESLINDKRANINLPPIYRKKPDTRYFIAKHTSKTAEGDIHDVSAFALKGDLNDDEIKRYIINKLKCIYPSVDDVIVGDSIELTEELFSFLREHVRLESVLRPVRRKNKTGH